MKYRLKLIRSDIAREDMLLFSESSLVSKPNIQRISKKDLKNSVQVKFSERWTATSQSSICNEGTDTGESYSPPDYSLHVGYGLGGFTVQFLLNVSGTSYDRNMFEVIFSPSADKDHRWYTDYGYVAMVDPNGATALTPIYHTIQRIPIRVWNCVDTGGGVYDCTETEQCSWDGQVNPSWNNHVLKTSFIDLPFYNGASYVFSFYLTDIPNNDFSCGLPFYYRAGDYASFQTPFTNYASSTGEAGSYSYMNLNLGA